MIVVLDTLCLRLLSLLTSTLHLDTYPVSKIMDVISFESVSPVAALAPAIVAEPVVVEPVVEQSSPGKRQRKRKSKSTEGSSPKKANVDTFVRIGQTRSPRVLSFEAILELCCTVDRNNENGERKNTIFAAVKCALGLCKEVDNRCFGNAAYSITILNWIGSKCDRAIDSAFRVNGLRHFQYIMVTDPVSVWTAENQVRTHAWKCSYY